uniref:Uncharacterized protein n=1 Tax=Anguilla anguilla TaxID=7936 RepID=A0A0E9XC23_ANGAN
MEGQMKLMFLVSQRLLSELARKLPSMRPSVRDCQE